MSSGTQTHMGMSPNMLTGTGGENALGQSGGLELNPRQHHLTWLWATFRCQTYDGRKTEWDGTPATNHIERAQIATQGYVPPGFVDLGAESLPLRFRKPSAPYHLVRPIVLRFSGLLFANGKQPRIVCPEDRATEEWLNGVVLESRLWARMLQARNFGGAMGSVAVGFKFVNGKPVVELHDPRWVRVEFADREDMIVKRFEKRYQYKDMHEDPITGQRVEGWFWYRRVITEKHDVVWTKVPVLEGGEEPVWKNWKYEPAEHNYGFCPIVWIQNTPALDEADGDPDCHGAFDMIDRMDMLSSQADRGTLANCDPTLLITSEDDLPEMRKGSDNAIKLTEGSASYMEMQGAGIKMALDLADKFEERILRLVRCVLDDSSSGPAKTAEEVKANYSAMYEQAETLREQYGEYGVKRLLEMILKAARGLMQQRAVKQPDGTVMITRQVVKLRPAADGTPRQIGNGLSVELKWPEFQKPSLAEITSAVDAAGKAKQYTLIDTKHAAQFVAGYFQVEDVDAMLEVAKEEAAQAQQAMYDQTMGGFDGGGGIPPEEGEEAPPEDEAVSGEDEPEGEF